MAASAKWDDDDGINEINVTPLVDVMLVQLTARGASSQRAGCSRKSSR